MLGLMDAGTAPDALRASLRAPASAVLSDVGRQRRAGGLGARETADLARIADAAGLLLRFVHEGAEALVPSAAVPESPPASVPELAVPSGPAARVLIVDDDPANRELLARRVEREGWEAIPATGGDDALARLEAGRIDLVLLDLVMPGVGGDEVLRRLKRDPRHADLPVLMISALDEQEAVVRCIEDGAEDYLPKQVDQVLLRARIGACLRKKRVRDEELAYLRDVRAIAASAAALQGGEFDPDALAAVCGRTDALGRLARVFTAMAGEVRAREQRLASQVAQLRIEIDETRKARAVAEIVESDHFQDLQRRLAELRRRPLAS
jgi:DNA-binding response OmpR family regulator